MKRKFLELAYGALAAGCVLVLVGQTVSAQPSVEGPAAVADEQAPPPAMETVEATDGQGASAADEPTVERKRRFSAEIDVDSGGGLGDALIPILGIIGVFGMPALIVGLALYFAYRRSKMRHETLLALADRGVDITKVDLIEPADRKDKSPIADLRTGLVLLAVGSGISIMLYVLGIKHIAGVGAIPGLIGLAYIVVYAVRRKGASAE